MVLGGGLDTAGRPHPWVTARLDLGASLAVGDAKIIVLSRGTTHKPPPLDECQIKKAPLCTVAIFSSLLFAIPCLFTAPLPFCDAVCSPLRLRRSIAIYMYIYMYVKGASRSTRQQRRRGTWSRPAGSTPVGSWATRGPWTQSVRISTCRSVPAPWYHSGYHSDDAASCF